MVRNKYRVDCGKTKSSNETPRAPLEVKNEETECVDAGAEVGKNKRECTSFVLPSRYALIVGRRDIKPSSLCDVECEEEEEEQQRHFDVLDTNGDEVDTET